MPTANFVRCLALLAAPACALPAAAQTGPDPVQVVTAIEEAFGVNKGERRNHIKGTCALGEFVGTPEAAAYSRSELFAGKPVPVVARFSLAGGNPKAPDTAKSGRGMALQFQLRNGSSQHITMLNTPMFGAATPQTFLDLMQALKPDPATGKPDPEKMKAFKASHPDNLAQSEFLMANNPPASYANSAFWGIHTFKFIGRDNKTTLVRWRFVPQDGEKRLSDEELKTAGANFLEPALIERASKGPVRWDMLVTIGAPGDPEDNPTLPWSAYRKEFKAGTLTITAAMAQKGAACEAINYDPLIMADGIAPTADPILQFRSPAYAVSFGKRMGER
jgi:catalase